jgi:uncharacterized phage-associated protein
LQGGLKRETQPESNLTMKNAKQTKQSASKRAIDRTEQQLRELRRDLTVAVHLARITEQYCSIAPDFDSSWVEETAAQVAQSLATFEELAKELAGRKQPPVRV